VYRASDATTTTLVVALDPTEQVRELELSDRRVSLRVVLRRGRSGYWQTAGIAVCEKLPVFALGGTESHASSSVGSRFVAAGLQSPRLVELEDATSTAVRPPALVLAFVAACS